VLHCLVSGVGVMLRHDAQNYEQVLFWRAAIVSHNLDICSMPASLDCEQCYPNYLFQCIACFADTEIEWTKHIYVLVRQQNKASVLSFENK
jgi:hypothetical protein